MKIRLGIDVACRAAHQASCADEAGVFAWSGHRFRTDITMADVIAEAHDAGQLALIPLADIA